MASAVDAVCGSRGEDGAGELPQNRHDVGEFGHCTEGARLQHGVIDYISTRDDASAGSARTLIGRAPHDAAQLPHSRRGDRINRCPIPTSCRAGRGPTSSHPSLIPVNELLAGKAH